MPSFFAMRFSWVQGHWNNQFAWQGPYFLSLSIKSRFNWQDQAGAFLPIIAGSMPSQQVGTMGCVPGKHEVRGVWSRHLSPSISTAPRAEPLPCDGGG